MKIKSSVLFGLIVVIFSVSGFSLLKRLTQDIDEWRPSDLYSTTNVTRRSTYSVVSSGASASYSGAAPSVTSGASSMFRRRAVSSYAPAMSAHSSLANSQYPIGGTPSNSVASPIYATSSAEFRSFGGGGNAGGVSMSGGSVKSSGSSMAPASGLNVSISSTSIYAFAGQNQSGSIPIVSGDAAIASVASASSYTTAYSGIGYASGGGPRALGGRQNAAPSRDPYDVWLEWLRIHGDDYADQDGDGVYDWNYENAWDAFCDWFGRAYPGSTPDDYTGADAAILWEQWLSWFMSNNGTHTDSDDNIHNFLPIGDYIPLLLMAMVYVGYIAIRRREKIKTVKTLD